MHINTHAHMENAHWRIPAHSVPLWQRTKLWTPQQRWDSHLALWFEYILLCICLKTKQNKTKVFFSMKLLPKDIMDRITGIIKYTIELRYWITGSKGLYDPGEKENKWNESYSSWLPAWRPFPTCSTRRESPSREQSEQRAGVELSWETRNWNLDIAKVAGIFFCCCGLGKVTLVSSFLKWDL